MDEVCTIKCLSEYIAAIENHQLFNSISRGENRKFETFLNSGIQRRQLRNYQKILDEYHLEVESSIDGIQEKHFLAFAQHHGVPTNLLDFSQSPLTSLFFAVDGCNEKGYVYFLDKKKLININKVVCQRKPGWGLLDDMLSFDVELFKIIYGQMSDVFIKNRELMISFFDQHTSEFITNFKKRRVPSYLNSIIGVSKLEKAFEKYKTDRQEWINKGMADCEITLQIKDSVPNLLNGFAQIYKDDILYPADFIHQYNSMTKLGVKSALYSANIDVMLFLLKMEKLELRDLNMLRDGKIHTEINYELEFPYYFTYQPPIIDERVKNQSSMFIFQPFSENVNPRNGDIEQVWLRIIPNFIIEIENPDKIKEELDSIGINSKHVYCDYDHIAHYIASKY